MTFKPYYFPVCVICVVLGPRAVAAQTVPAAAPERPTAVAMRLNPEERISVDGVLDEPPWERAQPMTDFKQSEPRNGDPGTERTQIRILFDEDNLYIGAQFFDSDPAGILGNQMIRDGALAADDRFMWVLDPLNDRSSGYFFEINPAGAMGDAQLIAAQGGATIGLVQNRAWNGIWLARVRRTDQGWMAEVEIPFRTLNFDPNSEEWGANFQRTVRRKNEDDFWSGWARNQGLFNLTSAGRLVGITDVNQGHGIDIKPYLVGTYLGARAPRSSGLFTGSEGLDVFYNVTPRLRANLTINTDFAQTEVDDRQVNLTRFPLFFPEKRDFFLEGAGNFDFSRESAVDMTAFFSRRIGLDDKGQPQDIDYGAKVAGNAAGLNLGLMQVRTGQERGNPSEDFTIVRPKRQFFRESYAGMIYTRRATRASLVPDRQSIGADFLLGTSRFRGSENLQLNGYFLKTPNGISRGDDAGYGFRLLYPNDRWSGRLIFKEFQKNFDPAVGFRQRADDREYNLRTKFAPRPKNSRVIRQAGAEMWLDWYSDTRGRWYEKNDQYIFNLDLQSGDGALFTFNPIWERLPEPFRIASGITLPMGSEYKYYRYNFRADTTNRRPIALTGNMALGSFFSGHRRDLGGSITLRPRRGVLAQISVQSNKVDLAEGHFSTKLVRAQLNTQFNPFVSVSNNIQYDSVSRVLGWQSRFRWIAKPGNDIYFVWMTNWLEVDDRLATLDRNAAVKLLYTYRL
jgi:hypothetical protein